MLFKNKKKNIDCNFFIKYGMCKADCCQIIPFPYRVYKKYKHLRAKKVLNIKNYYYNEVFEGGFLHRFFPKKFPISKNVLISTEDWKCCFLSIRNKCSIYKKRPKICKKFINCPHMEVKK